MKKLFNLLFFILLTSHAFSARVNEYIEKINANYLGLSSLELEMEYKLFKGHNSAEVVDTYTSTLKMEGKKSHRRIYDDEIITNDDLTLVINHQLRTIEIMPVVQEAIIDKNIQKNIKNCKDIQLFEIDDNTKKITLQFKEISSLPYSRVDIYVDKDFWVTQIIFFYATQLNFSGSSFTQEFGFPRLEVNYSSFNKSWRDKEGITNTAKYITISENTVNPAPLYQDYKILN